MPVMDRTTMVREYRRNGFKDPEHAADLMSALADAWMKFQDDELSPRIAEVVGLAPRGLAMGGSFLAGSGLLPDGTRLEARVEITYHRPSQS